MLTFRAKKLLLENVFSSLGRVAGELLGVVAEGTVMDMQLLLETFFSSFGRVAGEYLGVVVVGSDGMVMKQPLLQFCCLRFVTE